MEQLEQIDIEEIQKYLPMLEHCKYCKQDLESCDCDSPFWREGEN